MAEPFLALEKLTQKWESHTFISSVIHANIHDIKNNSKAVVKNEVKLFRWHCTHLRYADVRATKSVLTCHGNAFELIPLPTQPMKVLSIEMKLFISSLERSINQFSF